MDVKDVIVVGCGASGVAALSKLQQAGLNVLGLEASDRIGGRVRTESFADGTVDIGAAWCHGEKDNIVYELANPLNLLAKPLPGKRLFMLSNGDQVSSEEANKFKKSLDDALAKANKDEKKSILQFTNEVSMTIPMEAPLKSALLEWYQRENHLGGPVDPTFNKSLKSLEEYWICEGEQMLNWKGRGYKSILDVLLNRYPDASKEIPVQILTNTEVETIKWNVQSDSQPRNNLVQVKCMDGTVYTAKSVLVTVSIGVLNERHMNLFTPSLPQNKINVLNTYKMCLLDKIYVEFAQPWWETPSCFSILWREEEKQMFSEQDKWITEIFGYLTIDHQPNVLLFWICGEGAQNMMYKTEDEVLSGVGKLLQVVFKNYNVSKIKNVLRTKWGKNRWVRGAYAYRTVATELLGGLGAKELSEPITIDNFPVLCFGGEATSHHRHSAVQGAIEAGFREADRLIDSFKTLKT